MAVRLATFNVENLFERAKALDTTTWAEGEPVLAAFGRFTTLSAKTVYTDADKQDMLRALETLRVLVRDSGGRLVLNPRPFEAWALRENRGDFLKQPAGGDAVIVATGRGDWIGWVDLITEPVDETATRMTAKVIDEVAADILCVVEAEHRPSLVRFSAALLDRRYAHAMLVDGNDPRRLDDHRSSDHRVGAQPRRRPRPAVRDRAGVVQSGLPGLPAAAARRPRVVPAAQPLQEPVVLQR
ncbi:hypothetical protein [Saccharothrix sp. NRRL B-16348]|uniref:hypothetical protein n=1 Tax=Saccharothrix sp. NRRL B-16348 TaxID=1415542 RepID=UPI0006AEAEA0|nr:hypothetical protein [Saccharothrix sp. NRRL B-16348]